MKFKKGDNIVVKEFGNGFESATVTGITKEKGRKFYTLKILRGIATIPVSAEINYELSKV